VPIIESHDGDLKSGHATAPPGGPTNLDALGR
jgi:hypothetical protein